MFCGRPDRFYKETLPSKFYVKRNFKTRLTNSVKDILRIQMVRLRERVENRQNFTGNE